MELKEVTIINVSIYDNHTDIYSDKDANEKNNSYYSNLTELSIKSFETDEMKIESSKYINIFYNWW